MPTFEGGGEVESWAGEVIPRSGELGIFQWTTVEVTERAKLELAKANRGRKSDLESWELLFSFQSLAVAFSPF